MNSNTLYIAEYAGVSLNAAIQIQDKIDRGALIRWSAASYAGINKVVDMVLGYKVFVNGEWITYRDYIQTVK